VVVTKEKKPQAEKVYKSESDGRRGTSAGREKVGRVGGEVGFKGGDQGDQDGGSESLMRATRFQRETHAVIFQKEDSEGRNDGRRKLGRSVQKFERTMGGWVHASPYMVEGRHFQVAWCAREESVPKCFPKRPPQGSMLVPGLQGGRGEGRRGCTQ
jgi:hypothetical protein